MKKKFKKMPEIPFSIQWTIDENELLPLKNSINGYLFSTSALNIPEFEYYLKISPNGNSDQYRGQTWIFLCLELKNVKKVEAVITATSESANYSEIFENIYEKSHCMGCFGCKTEEFFDPEKKFIVDGKFIVKVNGIFKYDSEDTDPAAIDNGQQKWIGGELGDESWKRDDTKDFTIITGDKEIKVHKFVLGIRSEVFTSMLNSNMKESKENKVAITDFSFAVVETAVKLIYHCTFTSKLSMDELMSLLQFFDKYQLPSLKDKIESLLIGKISAATVCRLTNCSILTNSFKLKEKCMEFLSAAFKSQTPLVHFKDLDKDIISEIVENSFYKILVIEK